MYAIDGLYILLTSCHREMWQMYIGKQCSELPVPYSDINPLLNIIVQSLYFYITNWSIEVSLDFNLELTTVIVDFQCRT